MSVVGFQFRKKEWEGGTKVGECEEGGGRTDTSYVANQCPELRLQNQSVVRKQTSTPVGRCARRTKHDCAGKQATGSAGWRDELERCR